MPAEPNTARADKKARDTYDYIKGHISAFKPAIGIILGTGLGGLVKDVKIKFRLDYKDIPNFPVSTVESHHGNLIFGEISGQKAVIMQGRFHFYEGYSHDEVTFPVRVMNKLGIKTLLVSNACGGLNPVFRRSDLMIMSDHINFHFETPFRNFPVSYNNRRVYDKGLMAMAYKAALENRISVRKGVYLSLRGPALETKAEYRMARRLGADVVGMSTIPEALVAVNHKMKVLGLSIITDMGLPDTLEPAAITEILEAAAEAEPKLTLLTKKIIEKL